MVCAYGIPSCTRVFYGTESIAAATTSNDKYHTGTTKYQIKHSGVRSNALSSYRYSRQDSASERCLQNRNHYLPVPSLELHIVFHRSGSRPPSNFEGIPSRALPFPNSGTTHGGNIDISMCCERISM